MFQSLDDIREYLKDNPFNFEVSLPTTFLVASLKSMLDKFSYEHPEYPPFNFDFIQVCYGYSVLFIYNHINEGMFLIYRNSDIYKGNIDFETSNIVSSYKNSNIHCSNIFDKAYKELLDYLVKDDYLIKLFKSYDHIPNKNKIIKFDGLNGEVLDIYSNLMKVSYDDYVCFWPVNSKESYFVDGTMLYQEETGHLLNETLFWNHYLDNKKLSGDDSKKKQLRFFNKD